ncbi:MAG: carboxyltransferase domain-containing protein [Fusobacterium sp.]
MKFLKAGDSSLVIELGNEISPIINFKLKKITEFLDNANIKGIKDLLPTYRSIIVYYNPLIVSFEEIKEIVEINCNFEHENTENIENIEKNKEEYYRKIKKVRKKLSGRDIVKNYGDYILRGKIND